jgi:hypothetical protein
MKTFKEFIREETVEESILAFVEAMLEETETTGEEIAEGNQNQQKINKKLSSGKSLGFISHEGPHNEGNPAQRKADERTLRTDLESARKAGHIGGWSGPHKGQYKYASGPKDVAKEKSYIIHSAGSTKEHHAQLRHTLKALGNKHNQESVLDVHPSGKASLSHLKRSPKTGQKERMGTLTHNKELTTGSGNTGFKKGSGSVTAQ